MSVLGQMQKIEAGARVVRSPPDTHRQIDILRMPRCATRRHTGIVTLNEIWPILMLV